MSSKFNKAACAVILAVLFFPLLEGKLNLLSDKSLQEGRLKKESPGKDFIRGPWADPGFAFQYEEYFGDSFPLRGMLMRAIGQIRFDLFGTAGEVVVGQDGWLIDKKIALDHLVQLDRVDDDQIKAGILAIKKLQYWLNQRGIYLLVVIVPMKSTIYLDKYPNIRMRSEPTGLDLFQSGMAMNDIPFVDLKSKFLNIRLEKQLYYKTDIHWNTVGAKEAAHLIVDNLSDLYLKKKIWSDSHKYYINKFSGGELSSIPMFTHSPEDVAEVSVKAVNIKPDGLFNGQHEAFIGVNPSLAKLPPLTLFGNSFALKYQGIGLHDYFKKSNRVLDYQYFNKVSQNIQPETKIFILNIYETQLLYHIMPKGFNTSYPSQSSEYWDPEILKVKLPDHFQYVAPLRKGLAGR